MSYEMRTALARRGYSPAPHAPRKAGKDMVPKQDLVLCMSDSEVSAVLNLDPDSAHRVHMLPAYAGFPDEEVIDPHSFMKEIPMFPAIGSMPCGLRQMVYRIYGYTDPRDEEVVIRLHVGIVRQIERYVDHALERMKRERALL